MICDMCINYVVQVLQFNQEFANYKRLKNTSHNITVGAMVLICTIFVEQPL